MAIVQSITTATEFSFAFDHHGRGDNFSWEGQQALFNYFDEMEGTVDLDVVAICCDYSEDTWQNIAGNYRIDLSECEDEEEKKQAVIDYLQDNTSYVGEGEDDNLVYAAF